MFLRYREIFRVRVSTVLWLTEAPGLNWTDNGLFFLFFFPAGRRSSAGSGSVDSDRKKWLHQFTELQLLLCLSVHPDSCRSHSHSDGDDRMLCHTEGDEESFDCGEQWPVTPNTTLLEKQTCWSLKSLKYRFFIWFRWDWNTKRHR